MAQELDGVADAYRAPVEDEGKHVAREGEGPEFFVISVPKLLVYEVLTLHLYSVYWFYKHWSAYRRQTGQRLQPLLRAIFNVFFVHRLFKAMDFSARSAGFSPSWSASSQATLFVGLSIVSWLADRGSSGVAGTVISVAFGVATILPIINAQKVANLASGDPEARSNARFGAASALVALLGLVLWALMIRIVLEARNLAALAPAVPPGL